MDFRPAYRALKERLESELADVVRTVTRKNLPANAFPEGNQPALVIVENGDEPIPDDDRAVAWMLHAQMVLHSRVSAEEEAPGDALLEMRDRIEKALLAKDGESRGVDGASTTLGGLVRWVRLGPVSIQDDFRDASQVSQVFYVSMLVTPPAE